MRRLINRAFDVSIVKFLAVGGLGTAVNTAVFALLTAILKLAYNLASIIAFCVVVTQNYVLNGLWTFSKRKGPRLDLRSYFYYVVVNLGGLAINILILNFLILVMKMKEKSLAQLFSIGSATLLNYGLSRTMVFKRSHGGSGES